MKNLRQTLAASFLFSAFLALGQTTDSTAEEAKKGFSFSGNSDVFFRKSYSGTESTTHYPTLSNEKLDWGWINLATEWRKKKWHALLDLAVGPRARAFSGEKWHSTMQQIQLTHQTTEKLALSGGYFYFPFNWEYPQAGKNALYSYSILYSFLPVSYTGLKADYAFSENLTAYAGLFSDPNRRFEGLSPHPTCGLYFEKGKGSLAFNFIAGKEFETGKNVSTELIGSYQLAEKWLAVLDLQLTNDLDWAEQYSAAVAYLTFDAKKWVSFTARGEVFRDRAGYFLGEADDQIFALTVGPSIQFRRFFFKPEFRIDSASKAVFADGGKKEAAFTLALMHKFGSYPE